MTSIISVVIRRLLGIALVISAGAYVAGMHYNYDIPKFDLPHWVHSPVFYSAFIAIAVWCWLPVLVTMPSRRQVNLTPTNQSFEVPMQANNSDGWGQPFEMPPGSGQWHIQGHGQYWKWDNETREYQPLGSTEIQ